SIRQLDIHDPLHQQHPVGGTDSIVAHEHAVLVQGDHRDVELAFGDRVVVLAAVCAGQAGTKVVYGVPPFGDPNLGRWYVRDGTMARTRKGVSKPTVGLSLRSASQAVKSVAKPKRRGARGDFARRVLDVKGFLLTSGGATIYEIAKHFGVSTR